MADDQTCAKVCKKCGTSLRGRWQHGILVGIRFELGFLLLLLLTAYFASNLLISILLVFVAAGLLIFAYESQKVRETGLCSACLYRDSSSADKEDNP